MKDNSYNLEAPDGIEQEFQVYLDWEIACFSSGRRWYEFVGAQPGSYPWCCSKHSDQFKDLGESEINDIKIKIESCVSYTLFTIKRFSKNDTFFDEYSEYIDLAAGSFGDSKLGVDIFSNNLIKFIKQIDEIHDELKLLIIDYINWNYCDIDIEMLKTKLSEIWNIWLELFPYDLPQFEHLINEHRKKSTQIFQPEKSNRYLTPEQLKSDLNKTVNKLFSSPPIINISFEKYRSLVTDKCNHNKLLLTQTRMPEKFLFVDTIMKFLEIESNRQEEGTREVEYDYLSKIERIYNQYLPKPISSVFETEEDYQYFLAHMEAILTDNSCPEQTKLIKIKNGSKRQLYLFLRQVWYEFNEKGLKADLNYLESLKFIKHFNNWNADKIYRNIYKNY